MLGDRRVTVTEEPDVLGVRVRNIEEPAVLGDRRGKTGETDNAARAMVLMPAGVVLCALTRKREYA